MNQKKEKHVNLKPKRAKEPREKKVKIKNKDEGLDKIFKSKDYKKGNVININLQNNRTDFIPKPKNLNKKKIIIASVIISIIAIFLILLLIYSLNENFRKFCDMHLLGKNVSDKNLVSIEIQDVANSNIFACSNNIVVLKNNTLEKYNSLGKKEADLKLEITTPLVFSSNNYMIVAEKLGKKLYVIYKDEIIWQKELEGNITRVNINENGYASVVLSGTAYKSVINVFDNKGNELFKTYLSTTIAVDSTISQDNKLLAFAEVDIDGTIIESNIKIVSIEKAKENPSDSIIFTQKGDQNSLIVSIKYQNRGKLVCLYDDSIHVIDDTTDKTIATFEDTTNKNSFSDINLNSYAVNALELNNNIFNSNTRVELINTANNNKNIYNLDGTAKELSCYGDKIGINLGSEVHFINTNGWLIKKYNADQEVRKIVMGKDLAGIVYKNKIEIINL